MAISDATEWTIDRGSFRTGIGLDTSSEFQAIDATNGNVFKNDGNVRLIFLGNTGATGYLSVKTASECNYYGGGSDHLSYQHDMVTVASTLDASTKELVLGPFPPNIFNRGDYKSMVWVQYTGTMTGVTCAVVSEESSV